MNRQDAMKALVRAGKQREVVELLERAGEQAARRYDAIRSDESRSETWKNWQLANACRSHLTSVEVDLAAMARRCVSDDHDDAARVFGIKGIDGDPASLIISRRDAADRVARVETPEEMRALLASATRSGDEPLARAIAERAVTEQDDATMHQFLNARPHLDKAGERLWNAQRAEVDGFAVNAHLQGLKPHELANSSLDDITEMAATEPSNAVA